MRDSVTDYLLDRAIGVVPTSTWVPASYASLAARGVAVYGPAWEERVIAAAREDSSAGLVEIIQEARADAEHPILDALEIGAARHRTSERTWPQVADFVSSLPDSRARLLAELQDGLVAWTVGSAFLNVGRWERAASWMAAAAATEEFYQAYATFVAGLSVAAEDPMAGAATCLDALRAVPTWPFVVDAAIFCRHLALRAGDQTLVAKAWACVAGALGSRNTDYLEEDRFRDAVSLGIAVALGGYFADASEIVREAKRGDGFEQAELVARRESLCNAFPGDDSHATGVRAFAAACLGA